MTQKMTQVDEMSTQIQAWITRSFPLAQQRGVGPNDSLLDSGIVDSLGTLEIVQFLETEFGIQITDDEMMADHFESIHAIASFVDRKHRS